MLYIYIYKFLIVKILNHFILFDLLIQRHNFPNPRFIKKGNSFYIPISEELYR